MSGPLGILDGDDWPDARHVAPSLPQRPMPLDWNYSTVQYTAVAVPSFFRRKALEYTIWNAAGTINHSIPVMPTLQIYLVGYRCSPSFPSIRPMNSGIPIGI
jgi:hypothetical protein